MLPFESQILGEDKEKYHNKLSKSRNNDDNEYNFYAQMQFQKYWNLIQNEYVNVDGVERHRRRNPNRNNNSKTINVITTIIVIVIIIVTVITMQTKKEVKKEMTNFDSLLP